MYKYTLLLIASLSLFACRQTRELNQTVEITNIDEVSSLISEEITPPPGVGEPKFPLPTDLYRVSRTKEHDLIHTQLAISFDWEKRHVLGTAKLTLKPYFYPTDVVKLDARGFDLHQVMLLGKNGKAKPLEYTYDSLVISIQLDKTYTKEEEFGLLIGYTAKPYELTTKGGQAITDDRGLYFINHDGKHPYKPQQIWTQGETQASSCWFPTIDAPNERTTQEIAVTVQNKFLTISNGKKISSMPNNDGTRTDVWRQEIGHAPYLFALVVGEFVEHKDTWRDKEVNYYMEKDYGEFGDDVFGNTPEMIEFFSTKLGVDFPWDKYSQVVVREFVSGAMENTSCVIFYDALNQTKREMLDESNEDIIAHELFHHWFGDLVTCESWSNLGLNESFASYGEYLWFEHKYGKDYADHHLDQDLNLYLMESRSKMRAIVDYGYENADAMFDRHSYQKGARVLHLLRNEVGDDAFFAALKHYLSKHAYSDVEMDELRLSFEDVTGRDLNWFFNQWFMRPGHPMIKMSYEVVDDSLEVYVAQIQDLSEVPLFRIPTYIQTTSSTGKKTKHQVELVTQDSLFRFAANADEVANVIFDADQILLGTIDEEKNLDAWINQLKYADNFKQKQIAITQLRYALQEDLPSVLQDEIVDVLLNSLKDPYWLIRDEARSALASYNGPRRKRLIQRFFQMAQKDAKATVRQNALSMFNTEEALVYLEEKELLTLLDQSITIALNDSSYNVQAVALALHYGRDESSALEVAKRVSPITQSAPLLLVASQVLIDQEGTAAFDQITQNLQRMSEKVEKYHMIQVYGGFLQELDEDKLTQGLSILMELARYGGQYWIRMAAARELETYADRADVKAFAREMYEQETSNQVRDVYQYMVE